MPFVYVIGPRRDTKVPVVIPHVVALACLAIANGLTYPKNAT